MTKNQENPKKFSWTQIRDTDACSNTDATKQDYDISSETLDDY